MKNPNVKISKLISTKHLILLLFVVAKFVLQYFAIDAGYDLHRDEYLHLDLGKHLAFGYTSVPPLTGFISYIILLLGNTVFWVKFFPALFGALVLWVVWQMVEVLKGGFFAQIMAGVSVLFSAFLRINTLYQPNSLDFLLWSVLLLMLLKFIKSENIKYLYGVSMAFAIGFLNKYNIAFLLLGIIPALLLTKHRKIFINKHLYLSLLLAFILISPNLWWQYQNDFPVYHHLRTLSETQLVNVQRFDFLKDQILFFTGSIFIILLSFISFFTYKEYKKYLIFFLIYVFTIAIFLYFRAKSYYSIGLYPVFLAFGSVYLEKLLAMDWRRYLKPLALAVPIIIILPMYQIILPVLSPEQIVEKSELFKKYDLTRWEDGKVYDLPQDYADMIGWRELANIVDSAFNFVNEKENTLIQCDNYGQAGAINYYGKQKFTQAVSMNADYINWYPLEKKEFVNIILVKEFQDEDMSREREKPLFNQITFIDEIKNKYARERGTRVYLLSGAKESINELLRNEIYQRKNEN